MAKLGNSILQIWIWELSLAIDYEKSDWDTKK